MQPSITIDNAMRNHETETLLSVWHRDELCSCRSLLRSSSRASSISEKILGCSDTSRKLSSGIPQRFFRAAKIPVELLARELHVQTSFIRSSEVDDCLQHGLTDLEQAGGTTLVAGIGDGDRRRLRRVSVLSGIDFSYLLSPRSVVRDRFTNLHDLLKPSSRSPFPRDLVQAKLQATYAGFENASVRRSAQTPSAEMWMGCGARELLFKGLRTKMA